MGQLLFQTEMKSSSAHATNGNTLDLGCHGDALNAWKRDAWRLEGDERERFLKSPLLAKVLVRMQPHHDFGRRRQLPLLIFWRAVAPDFGRCAISRVPGDHLFVVERPSYGLSGGRVPPTWPQEQENFDELWGFSVSSYLRSLGPAETLCLEMPNAVFRWRAMKAMGEPLEG